MVGRVTIKKQYQRKLPREVEERAACLAEGEMREARRGPRRHVARQSFFLRYALTLAS